MADTIRRYEIKNLDCASCAVEMETRVRRLGGVRHAVVDAAASTLLIDADDMGIVEREMRAVDPKVRIRPEVSSGTTSKDAAERRRRIWDLASMGIAVVLFVVGLLFEERLHQTVGSWAEYVVLLAAFLLAGWNVLLAAAKNTLKGRVFDENFLMTVATIGAIAVHALAEAAGVMLFYKAGEMLQGASIRRSRRTIRALLETRPQTANVQRDGRLVTVAPGDVRVGEEVVVRVGERVPLDGVVVQGSSSLDTSALTGESVPREVGKGDSVMAGTLNGATPLAIRATRAFAESSISRMMEMVQNATTRKARTEQFITRFARVYTPIVVGVALLIAVLPPLVIPGEMFRDWLYRALILLVISCPCALVASIPLSYFGGIGGASRRGVFVKGSNYLDAMSGVRTVVFDKTGTLTQGDFRVRQTVPHNGASAESLLRLAAMAEARSTHPIARSILQEWKGALNTDGAVYEEIKGHGVKVRIGGRQIVAGNDGLMHQEGIGHDSCTVAGTVVHVAHDGVYQGYLVVGDEPRPDAAQAVKELRELGVREVVMLTGDGEEPARAVARTLGVDSYRAGLLPEDKVRAVEELLARQPKGHRVAMVGDGINDAPVLARADVGIAMGKTGSDAAIETADVVLMTDSPRRVADAIRISRFTRRIVTQNVVMALVVKSVFVALGVVGVATMWEAVIGDMGVTLVAVLNATRVFGKGGMRTRGPA